MAQTFRSRQLRHERDMDNRFIADHAAIARRVGGIVQRYAVGTDRTVPNLAQTRQAIKRAAWTEILKPYYIGVGDDPFNGAIPQSQFARLLYDGIRGSVQIQVERQTKIVEKVTRNDDNDDLVYRWLTGSRASAPVLEIGRGSYDPFHRFVDPNGYTLSDRVWRDAVSVRSRIDGLLDYHIAQGTSAVDIADLLEDFLTPGAKLIKTATPYGKEGSYAARRLARTEITAAAGRATVNASKANPFVDSIKWRRSNNAEIKEKTKCEICAKNASGGTDGDGVYLIDKVPQYPAHPHDMCTLSPVVNTNSDDLIAQLRRDIQANNPKARQIKGLFNEDFLVNALMNKSIEEILASVAGNL